MPTHFPATYSFSERGVARPSEFYSMIYVESSEMCSCFVARAAQLKIFHKALHING